MNVIDALETIEAAPRGNARLAMIERLANNECAAVLRVFTDTLDPFITFGVQKLPTPTPTGKWTLEDWYADLLDIGARLRSRELTGNAAQETLLTHLGLCSEVQAKWSRRYFLRDLRLDIGAKALRKIFGAQFINLFEVPLAEPHDKVKPAVLEQGGWMVQPKLDGARCVAFIDTDGGVTLKSRTGKPWKNFESVRQALIRAVQRCGLRDFVFDGEVVSLDADGAIDFQALQKTMQKAPAEGSETGFLQYNIFDAAGIEEWKKPVLMYGERYAGISLALHGATNMVGTILDGTMHKDRLKIVPSTNFSDFVMPMNAATLDYLCRRYVDRGYEGAMLRLGHKPVVMKRSRDLLKVKTFQDAEGICIGLTEGEGKRAGRMGALVCKWKNGLTFKVGSGLSDAQLKELTAKPPLNQAITVKFFELTEDGVPRFPIFKCVRAWEDKPEADDES